MSHANRRGVIRFKDIADGGNYRWSWYRNSDELANPNPKFK